MPAINAFLKGALFGFILGFAGGFIYTEGLYPGPTPLGLVLEQMPWGVIGMMSAVCGLIALLIHTGCLWECWDIGDLIWAVVEIFLSLF